MCFCFFLVASQCVSVFFLECVSSGVSMSLCPCFFEQLIYNRASSILTDMQAIRTRTKKLELLLKEYYNLPHIGPIIPTQIIEDNLNTIAGDMVHAFENNKSLTDNYKAISLPIRRQVRLGIAEIRYHEIMSDEERKESITFALSMFNSGVDFNPEACLRLFFLKWFLMGESESAIKHLVQAHKLGHPRARKLLAEIGHPVANDSNQGDCNTFEIFRLAGSSYLQPAKLFPAGSSSSSSGDVDMEEPESDSVAAKKRKAR